MRTLSAKVSPDGQKELLHRLAEALTDELIKVPVGATGNMRRGVTVTMLPYKTPGGWAIGVGDLSILGSPSEPSPRGTISDFLKWYRRVHQAEERERKRKAKEAKAAKAAARKRKQARKKKTGVYGKGKKGEPLSSVYVPKNLDELVEAEAKPAELIARRAKLEEQRIALLRQISPLVRVKQQAQKKIDELSSAIDRMRKSISSPQIRQRIAQYEEQLAEVQRQVKPINDAYEEAQRRLSEIERLMSE